jgi:hypothetical protein
VGTQQTQECDFGTATVGSADSVEQPPGPAPSERATVVHHATFVMPEPKVSVWRRMLISKHRVTSPLCPEGLAVYFEPQV